MTALHDGRKTNHAPNKILFNQFLSLALFAAIAACFRPSICPAESPHSTCVNPATGLQAQFELQLNLQLARGYLTAGQTEQAIPCLENAHLLDQGALDTAYDLGRAYLDTAKVDEARALIESQLQRQNESRLHNLLGVIDVRQTRFREAAEQFQVAAKEDPSEENLFDFATSLLRFAGPSSEQVFRFGISRYPRAVRMHLGLAYALWAQGQDLSAAQEMCAAAKIDPADPRVFEMLDDTEQIPASLQSEITARLAALVQMYPQNGKLLFYYAMAKSGVWSGQDVAHLDPVIPMLERSIALNPNLAGPHLYLARQADERGQIALALDHYQKAAALKPDDDSIAYRLAFAYKESGDKRMFQEELARYRALHEKANRRSSGATEQLEAIGAAK